MDKAVKEKIYLLKEDGLKPVEIGKELNIHVETIRSFLKRHPVNPDWDYCKFCGKRLVHTPGKMKKTFCNDLCRLHHFRAKKALEKQNRNITNK